MINIVTNEAQLPVNPVATPSYKQMASHVISKQMGGSITVTGGK